MASEQEIRKQMCEVGKRMYARNMAAANDGNISVKLGGGEWLCTPTCVSKGFMTPEMMCKVDAQGNVIDASGGYRPSSETPMHMRLYTKRDDIGAVVHAHPAHATAFAVAGIPLNKPIIPEAVIFLGDVPIVEYGTPTTDELPDNLMKYVLDYDAVLLESHGALTWGRDLISAYHLMESLEFYAEMMYKAKMLGGPRELSQGNVQRLHGLRKRFGVAK